MIDRIPRRSSWRWRSYRGGSVGEFATYRVAKSNWGSQLLRDALERIVISADAGGGQIIVVDADNERLVGWYGRHGFRPTGAANLRLFMKVATARQHLRTGSPNP